MSDAAWLGAGDMDTLLHFAHHHGLCPSHRSTRGAGRQGSSRGGEPLVLAQLGPLTGGRGSANVRRSLSSPSCFGYTVALHSHAIRLKIGQDHRVEHVGDVCAKI